MTVAKDTYKNYSPAGQDAGVLPLVENSTVVEIGFGSGNLLKELRLRGNDVYGTDVGEDIIERAKRAGLENVFLVDSSEQEMPFENDFFDAVYCYEVFEHLANPYRLFSEIRRILKPNHKLYFSVPTQEHTMGYGPNRHSFVYPGLLERKNLERFFLQMYFKIEYYKENSTGIIYHRNYILRNMKELNLPDIMQVIIEDHSVSRLYADILSDAELKAEIKREIEPYITFLETASKNNWGIFEKAMAIFLPLDIDYISTYLVMTEKFIHNGNRRVAKSILERSKEIQNLPESILRNISRLIQTISRE